MTGSEKEYAVKLKLTTARTWRFFTGSGSNPLRIHAARFTDKSKAELAATELVKLNPQYESKVVTI